MNYLIQLIPLSAAISLVYSCTRFEHPPRIVQHALPLFLKILLFMAAAIVVLGVLSAGL